MTRMPSERQVLKSSVIDWLLDSDPAIRWQVMQLIGADPEAVAAERAKVPTEGWGAHLLTLQGADGAWGGTAWNHGWDSTMHVLTLLRDFGLDPASQEARRAINLVHDHVRWMGWDWDGTWRGENFVGNPFFDGEVEPCINGQVLACGAYFGRDTQSERIIGRFLAEQLPDGGWNCEAERGSKRSSFNTTICVLEALLECELTGGTNAIVTESRLRGQEYILERRLFHRRSTGQAIERDREGSTVFTRFAFPTWWHYDVLRGLEYLRHAGVTPDERLDEAIDLVESKRSDDGRWLLEVQYPGNLPLEMDEAEGQPSRWVTIRALRVLDWYDKNSAHD